MYLQVDIHRSVQLCFLVMKKKWKEWIYTVGRQSSLDGLLVGGWTSIAIFSLVHTSATAVRLGAFLTQFLYYWRFWKRRLIEGKGIASKMHFWFASIGVYRAPNHTAVHQSRTGSLPKVMLQFRCIYGKLMRFPLPCSSVWPKLHLKLHLCESGRIREG